MLEEREIARVEGNRLTVRTLRGLPVELDLYTLSGRTILSRRISTRGTLQVFDLSRLPISPGSYVVQVRRGGELLQKGRLMVP
jgi:hypothetical protein